MSESSPRAVTQHHSTVGRKVESSGQLSLPTPVTPEEVARESSLGGAIGLCFKVAGYTLEKEVTIDLGCDKAQLSRWQNGTEGILWEKLEKLMDLCGNEAPILWMLHRRGYDLHSLRMRESETERELRKAREEIDELKREREITMNVLREVRA